MIDSPCHNCKDHAPGCHGSCAAYKEWRKPLEDRKAALAKDRIVDDVIQKGRLRHYREHRRYKEDKKKGGFRQ